MKHTNHHTVATLRNLLQGLPDDGIVVIENKGEDRVVLDGDVRVCSKPSSTRTTNDEDFSDGEEEFSCVVRITSWG
jgi:hypothetical protein